MSFTRNREYRNINRRFKPKKINKYKLFEIHQKLGSKSKKEMDNILDKIDDRIEFSALEKHKNFKEACVILKKKLPYCILKIIKQFYIGNQFINNPLISKKIIKNYKLLLFYRTNIHIYSYIVKYVYKDNTHRYIIFMSNKHKDMPSMWFVTYGWYNVTKYSDNKYFNKQLIIDNMEYIDFTNSLIKLIDEKKCMPHYISYSESVYEILMHMISKKYNSFGNGYRCVKNYNLYHFELCDKCIESEPICTHIYTDVIPTNIIKVKNNIKYGYDIFKDERGIYHTSTIFENFVPVLCQYRDGTFIQFNLFIGINEIDGGDNINYDIYVQMCVPYFLLDYNSRLMNDSNILKYNFNIFPILQHIPYNTILKKRPCGIINNTYVISSVYNINKSYISDIIIKNITNKKIGLTNTWIKMMCINLMESMERTTEVFA